MTLDEFKSHLKRINAERKELGKVEPAYNAGQLSENTFEYHFLGLLPCEVEFRPDGTVIEVVGGQYQKTHDSVENWKADLTKELTQS